jgi:chromosome segregation ATPase
MKKAQEDIARLTKELEQTKSNYKYSSDRVAELNKEVEELHAFFDVLPNATPRKDPEQYTTRSAMTRMAAWLATK